VKERNHDLSIAGCAKELSPARADPFRLVQKFLRSLIDCLCAEFVRPRYQCEI
jgi:hypothetical protein